MVLFTNSQSIAMVQWSHGKRARNGYQCKIQQQRMSNNNAHSKQLVTPANNNNVTNILLLKRYAESAVGTKAWTEFSLGLTETRKLHSRMPQFTCH